MIEGIFSKEKSAYDYFRWECLCSTRLTEGMWRVRHVHGTGVASPDTAERRDTDYTQLTLWHRLHTTHTSSKTHNSHSDTALLTTHASHNSHSNTDYTQLTQLTPTESHRWAASLVLHKFSTETAANPRIIWYRCGVGRIDPGWLFVRASRDELHSLLGSA